jgi:hypothetical protein
MALWHHLGLSPSAGKPKEGTEIRVIWSWTFCIF